MQHWDWIEQKSCLEQKACTLDFWQLMAAI